LWSVKKKRVRELTACHRALTTAKTWGEFQSQITPESYAGLLELLADAADFSTFYEEQLEVEPDKPLEQAKSEYMQLDIGERFPEDHDPFSWDQIPFVYDGDWPAWPAREMLAWVPDEISEHYGEGASSMLNGECLLFACSDERMLTAAFRRAGYRCVRDDKLVRLASGYVS